MPIVTASAVSRVTGLSLGVGGVDGACERAAAVSAEAEADARRIMGATAYAEVLEYYESAVAAEAARWTLFEGAVAGLAFARVAPTLGPIRATSKGGFTTAVGADQQRESLLSIPDVLALAGAVRDRAGADLAALAGEMADDSLTDTLLPPEPLYIC